MPKLYVGNVTNHVKEFTFWVKKASRPYVQSIGIGGQVWVAGYDLPQEDIDYILEQHTRYGLCSVPEALRSLVFDGMAYSIDRPITYEKMNELKMRFNSVLNKRGQELRTAAAIATNEFIENQLQSSQAPMRLGALEMDIEELVPPVGRDEDVPEVNDRITVSRTADPSTGRPRAPRGSRTPRRRKA